MRYSLQKEDRSIDRKDIAKNHSLLEQITVLGKEPSVVEYKTKKNYLPYN